MNEVDRHSRQVSSKNLGLVIMLNTVITLAEAIGGLISGSMALLSDAAHNLSDVITLIMSFVANKLSKRDATERETFGFRRSEILAAFINSATLILIAVVIIVEAIQRLVDPVIVAANWVIGLAILSILFNGLSVIVIRKDSKANINMRSAYVHLLSDTLTSVGVLLGGLAIKYLHWNRIDSVFSLIIAFYMFYLSWGIFRSSLRIIMQFTPEEIDIQKIAHEIEMIPGVKNIHHVHVWQINEHDLMFEAHVDIMEDIKVSGFEFILGDINVVLFKNGIDHSTIQPEFSVDDSKQIIH